MITIIIAIILLIGTITMEAVAISFIWEWHVAPWAKLVLPWKPIAGILFIYHLVAYKVSEDNKKKSNFERVVMLTFEHFFATVFLLIAAYCLAFV